jgi:hypothetical protein
MGVIITDNVRWCVMQMPNVVDRITIIDTVISYYSFSIKGGGRTLIDYSEDHHAVGYHQERRFVSHSATRVHIVSTL